MLTPLALVATLVAVAVPEEGHAQRASAVAGVAADTIPAVARRRFQRRLLFSPEYLNRLLYTAWLANEPQPTVEISPPDETGRAAAYARLWGIDERLALKIVENALAEGVDPDLAFRLVRVESVFRSNARGPDGALGLMQLMPATARSLDRSLRTEAAILDADTNLRIGFRYLRALIDRYDGDLRLGLLAYNRGTGVVDRALDEGRDPENGFTRRVLEAGGSPYEGTGVVEW